MGAASFMLIQPSADPCLHIHLAAGTVEVILTVMVPVYTSGVDALYHADL